MGTNDKQIKEAIGITITKHIRKDEYIVIDAALVTALQLSTPAFTRNHN